MKRMLASLLAALPLLFAQPGAFAQTGKSMADLEQAFLKEEYQHVIDIIDEVEKKVGRSPRLESIRAQACAGINRSDLALLSVLRYEQMVGDRLGPDHPGHAEMLALKEWAQAEVRAEIERRRQRSRKHTAKLAAQWDKEFESLRKHADEQALQAQKRFDEKIEPVRKTLSLDQMKYLIMTNSGERFARADVRSLDLPLFRSGIFSLDLTQSEFESWFVARAREHVGNDEFLQRYIENFKLMYGELQARGKTYQVVDFADLDDYYYRYTPFARFLESHYSRRDAKRYRPKIDYLSDKVRDATQTKALRALAPNARICYVARVYFFRGKVARLQFDCKFPATGTDLESLQKGIIEKYGQPDTVEPVKSNTGSRTITSSYKARHDALATLHSRDDFNFRGKRAASMTLQIVLSANR